MQAATTTVSSADIAATVNGASRTQKQAKPSLSKISTKHMKNQITGIDQGERTITISKFSKATVKKIKRLRRNAPDGHTVCFVFNDKGTFTGHTWGQNCGYSRSDLETNDDYQLDYNSLMELERLLAQE